MTADDIDLDVENDALAMITFISNRLANGVAPVLRSFANLSVNETRMVQLIGARLIRTAAEGARMIGIDQAAISRSVRRLIERGLVVAARDKRHKSRQILTLTSRGKDCARGLSRLHGARIDGLLSVLSPAERASFLAALGKVLANVEAANAVRPEADWFKS
jgi:DNA-binding MarR family transcriptional regulator